MPTNYNNPFAMSQPPAIASYNYGNINSDYAGMGSSTYNNPYNPMTMSIAGQYNQAPLNMYAQEATRTGPSTWAQLNDTQQNAITAKANDQAVARGNSATADTESRLAQEGGLTSGARERAAESGQKDTTAAVQNNNKQNSMNQMQIGVNDETNRISQLGQLPGMELQSLQPFEMDVQNNVNAANSANQYNMTQQQMYNQAVGANQQAYATENSGKK